MSAHSGADLQRIYEARFAGTAAYRKRVWQVLVRAFFQKFVKSTDTVLDLGCGYGEFINEVRCAKKLAMDLNPDAQRHLDSSVQFLHQDCATRWQVEPESLNVVFTSNFFEHLPDKASLGRTLDEIFRGLAHGGRLIALGPNVRYLPGAYWDFWDHHLPLTEVSLGEGLTNRGFEVIKSVDRFLPYTMVKAREYPQSLIKIYLAMPGLWPLFGNQFLVVAQKPSPGNEGRRFKP
jgi:SAM-dependent methyltransferase